MVGAPAPGPLRAEGARVWVAPVARGDLEPYRQAVEASRARLARWNPVDPDDLERHLRFQSSGHRTFIVHAREPAGGHGIVGRVNVTGVVRGRAFSAQLGYDAYDPYAGAGLFAEGLRLVVGLAFAPEPQGMGMHRLEAAVQPGNVISAGLLRSLGFAARGAWPAYLWLPDKRDRSDWRDHVIFGAIASEWPPPPYDLPPDPRPLVVLDPREEAIGVRVAAELAVPLLRASTLEALGPQGTARLLVDSPGAVLLAPGDWDLRAVLREAGYPPDAAVDVRPAAPEDGGAEGGAQDRARACDLALRARALAHGQSRLDATRVSQGHAGST